jgi:hypothetical protein
VYSFPKLTYRAGHRVENADDFLDDYTKFVHLALVLGSFGLQEGRLDSLQKNEKMDTLEFGNSEDAFLVLNEHHVN